MHKPGVQNLAAWYVARHRNYCSFMERLQKLIVKMLQADADARKVAAHKANPLGNAKTAYPMPRTLRYSDEMGLESRQHSLRDLPKSTHKFQAEQKPLAVNP